MPLLRFFALLMPTEPLYGVGKGVDLRLRCAIANARTDRSLRIRAQRAVSKRRAMKACAHAKAHTIQGKADLLRAPPLDPEGKHRALVLPCVERNLWKIGQPLGKMGDQAALVCVDRGDPHALDLPDPGKKPRYRRCGKRSRLKSLGHLLRHFRFERMITAPTLGQGISLYSFAKHKETASLRTEKPLMPGRAKGVDLHPLHIDGKMPQGLCGIDHKKDSALTAKLTESLQRK